MALIFLHIPKAAGSTLQAIIERQYHPESVYTIDGTRVRESIETFKQLSEAQRVGIRVLQGHMSFGLHRYLPQPTVYITLLREPVERILSHYHYVLSQPSHYLHQQVVGAGMSLKDYVSSGISLELDNGQTRILSGVEELEASAGFGSCSSDMLAEAKRNLGKHFAVVGLSERFDESLLLLRRAFGWRHVYYTRQNVGTVGSSSAELDCETRGALKRWNELDSELYEFARGLFEQKIEEQGPAFRQDLKRFRLLNTAYGRLSTTFESRGMRSLLSRRRWAP